MQFSKRSTLLHFSSRTSWLTFLAGECVKCKMQYPAKNLNYELYMQVARIFSFFASCLDFFFFVSCLDFFLFVSCLDFFFFVSCSDFFFFCKLPGFFLFSKLPGFFLFFCKLPEFVLSFLQVAWMANVSPGILYHNQLGEEEVWTRIWGKPFNFYFLPFPKP